MEPYLDTIGALLKTIGDDPFRLFATLLLIASFVSYLFFRNEHPMFRLISLLLLLGSAFAVLFTLIQVRPNSDDKNSAGAARYSHQAFDDKMALLFNELGFLTNGRLSITPITNPAAVSFSEAATRDVAQNGTRCRAVVDAADIFNNTSTYRYMTSVNLARLDLQDMSIENGFLQINFFDQLDWHGYTWVENSDGAWDATFIDGAIQISGGLFSELRGKEDHSDEMTAKLSRLLDTFSSLGEMCQGTPT